jgi:hypothetical protein
LSNYKAGFLGASIAAAAIMGAGVQTRIFLSEPHDKSLAKYQAQCNTLHVLVGAELAKHGYYFKAEEAKRFQWVADKYAEMGKGIKHSAHVDGMAWDMVRYTLDGNTISWKIDDYKVYGEAWVQAGKLVGIETNWGGNFTSSDAVHTSCTSPRGSK